MRWTPSHLVRTESICSLICLVLLNKQLTYVELWCKWFCAKPFASLIPAMATSTKPESKEKSTVLYTAPDMAYVLEKDPSTIYRALERLKIAPTNVTQGGISLYSFGIIKQLHDALG